MKAAKFFVTAILFFVIGGVILFSCSKVDMVVKNAKKNAELDKTLPIYDLNKENLKEISYNGKTYVIQEESVKQNQLNEPIGRVSQRVTIDENNQILEKRELMKIYVVPDGSEQKRIDLNFGWIYSLKNTDSDDAVAVVVNEKYRKAVLEE